MNMMLGPGPSSVATRVIGTGLLENFGCEAWRESAGRSDREDEGRNLSSGLSDDFAGDLRELGLSPEEDDPGVSLSAVERLETDFAFFVGVEGSPIRRSGAEDGALSVVFINQSFLGTSLGTLTSRSPVDFFDGGGPLMLSP